MRASIVGACLVCLVATGCGGGRRPDMPPQGRREEVWHAPVSQLLLKYVGPDGQLTRAQMEAGLHRDFDAADRNHSGVLEADEARAVNTLRWEEDRSAVSPLQDWNGDGVIDFNEYAAAPRALFNELDIEHKGILTVNLLRAARGLGPETGQGGSEHDSAPAGGERGRHRGPGGSGPGN